MILGPQELETELSWLLRGMISSLEPAQPWTLADSWRRLTRPVAAEISGPRRWYFLSAALSLGAILFSIVMWRRKRG